MADFSPIITDLEENLNLTLALTGQLIASMLCQYFYIFLQKTMSDLTQVMTAMLKTFGLWAFSLWVMEYEVYNWTKLMGFLIIILGDLIYFEGLPVPYVTNRWRKNILKRSFILSVDDDDLRNTYWGGDP